jgi:hypothetical protein
MRPFVIAAFAIFGATAASAQTSNTYCYNYGYSVQCTTQQQNAPSGVNWNLLQLPPPPNYANSVMQGFANGVAIAQALRAQSERQRSTDKVNYIGPTEEESLAYYRKKLCVAGDERYCDKNPQ